MASQVGLHHTAPRAETRRISGMTAVKMTRSSVSIDLPGARLHLAERGRKTKTSWGGDAMFRRGRARETFLQSHVTVSRRSDGRRTGARYQRDADYAVERRLVARVSSRDCLRRLFADAQGRTVHGDCQGTRSPRRPGTAARPDDCQAD